MSETRSTKSLGSVALDSLTPADLERFRDHIAPQWDTCWLWTGELNRMGYGRLDIYRNNRRYRVMAHRLSYFLAHGSIPGDQLIRHTCDQPSCCNPHHLILGDQKQNMQGAKTRGRVNLGGLHLGRVGRVRGFYERMARGVKTCPQCLVEKSLEEFGINRSQADGRQGWCRTCRIRR